jgi:lipoate-protein ligase A
MSRGAWRLLDSGLRSAAENIALDRALLQSLASGEAPCTLRFLRFSPCALVGFHQDVREDLYVEYCIEHGIEMQRRVTGGGAIYLDENQLGWELFIDRRLLGTADMAATSARLCEAAARGIRRLGVNARHRPRNDIEVEGRKISGTGGAFDGISLLFQGTLLIDFDVEKMLRVLRVPAEKLSDKAVASARERVASLLDLMGRQPPLEDLQGCLAESFAQEFAVRFEAGGLAAREEGRYLEALDEVGDPDWVWQADRPYAEPHLLEGLHRCPGGLLRVRVLFDQRADRLKQVWYSGDFFVSPQRAVLDLEAALRDVPLSDLASRIGSFFSARGAELLLMTPRDFVMPVLSALQRVRPTDGAAQG